MSEAEQLTPEQLSPEQLAPEQLAQSLDRVPGFRRRIEVTAREGVVAAMLEDDIHCLAVTLRHDGLQVTRIETEIGRLPWTTCAGAPEKLVETFAGQLLSDVTARRDKKQNCTHFHDMAVLAAAHAGAQGTVIFDMIATDPVGGLRRLELRRDGELIQRWTEQDGLLSTPPEVAGRALFALRDWIATLPEPAREAARLLQWASLVAYGRTMPLDQQSIASELPPNCYTFQPERAKHAVRNGTRRDFSDGSCVPLAEFRHKVLAAL